MDVSEIKLVIEAALLAAGRPLPFEKLVELFSRKGNAPERALIREALDALAADYAERGIELKEVSSGFRIQVRSSMADWLQPLWEERAPRYTRALLETLALIAYRQPITRSEIEEVRGVAVSSNIVRTLMERGWVRVVGHRDVPGKPAMLGTTREFLDYFGLRKLEDLPTLAEFNEEPSLSPQGDFLESFGDGDEAASEHGESTPAADLQIAMEQTADIDAADTAGAAEEAAEDTAHGVAGAAAPEGFDDDAGWDADEEQGASIVAFAELARDDEDGLELARPDEDGLEIARGDEGDAEVTHGGEGGVEDAPPAEPDGSPADAPEGFGAAGVDVGDVPGAPPAEPHDSRPQHDDEPPEPEQDEAVPVKQSESGRL